MIDDSKCVRCEASSDVVKLTKCIVCYGYYCDDCAFRATGGRRLCSESCAQILMQGDEDELEDESGSEE